MKEAKVFFMQKLEYLQPKNLPYNSECKHTKKNFTYLKQWIELQDWTSRGSWLLTFGRFPSTCAGLNVSRIGRVRRYWGISLRNSRDAKQKLQKRAEHGIDVSECHFLVFKKHHLRCARLGRRVRIGELILGSFNRKEANAFSKHHVLESI